MSAKKQTVPKGSVEKDPAKKRIRRTKAEMAAARAAAQAERPEEPAAPVVEQPVAVSVVPEAAPVDAPVSQDFMPPFRVIKPEEPAPAIKQTVNAAMEQAVRNYGHLNSVPTPTIEHWLECLQRIDTNIVYQQGRQCSVLDRPPTPTNLFKLRQSKSMRGFTWNEKLATLR